MGEQTEWSKSGQYTSYTDLDLTPFGVEQMKRTGKALFGTGFIKPDQITYILTSPRKRALQTIQLILESVDESIRQNIQIVIDEDLREWEYGDYEGLLTKEIIAKRAAKGLDQERPWLIWRDGCENGETSEQVGLRLSRVIDRIQGIHKKAISEDKPSDVLVFAHGHTLRYFAALWFKLGIEKQITNETPKYVKSYSNDSIEPIHRSTYRYLQENPNFLLDAGGVGVLSYAHHNIEEPALSLAGAFTIPPEEQIADSSTN
ncbi:putative phosphoglycerate mutase [Wickerhamomyces ciferrii]|uniref:Phosphoglycerate mutase n=1 Tax=Wickerhamomyces ciferrii (strain ATCC 14091 / BCRC 22168 / CBS 111 / JCM 3599 / NBRC 0793 / NRRL Y-1031 F-60-10) TaxID=1206466 RepID=K0KUV0_WICCF|nr:putative phosphoglycerate mutase [Wickerhamomyces ciferrii]CCH45209.1 putative phosphoglycerate mutase [Wickerhamomyces ciferrii]